MLIPKMIIGFEWFWPIIPLRSSQKQAGLADPRSPLWKPFGKSVALSVKIGYQWLPYPLIKHHSPGEWFSLLKLPFQGYTMAMVYSISKQTHSVGTLSPLPLQLVAWCHHCSPMQRARNGPNMRQTGDQPIFVKHRGVDLAPLQLSFLRFSWPQSVANLGEQHLYEISSPVQPAGPVEGSFQQSAPSDGTRYPPCLRGRCLVTRWPSTLVPQNGPIWYEAIDFLLVHVWWSVRVMGL